MIYKSVFFGYFAATAAVVASLVLILIMHHEDAQYERRKLQALTGVLISSLVISTLYFLSFFDSLTTLSILYGPIERMSDILCSFGINLCYLLYLYFVAKEQRLARRLFRPALIILIAVFLFAGIVYVAAVTDEYRAVAGYLLLVEIAQVLLTATICASTIVFTWLAVRGQNSGLNRFLIAAGIVNVATAIYNAAGALAMFRAKFDYTDWSGPNDFNTWLFLLQDVAFMLLVVWYYRRQEGRAVLAEAAPGQTAGAGDGPRNADEESDPDNMTESSVPTPQIPDELGLTPRETEIAALVLQRYTYREIAEHLTISEYTVKRHVHNIYEKAGVSRREELIRQLSQEQLSQEQQNQDQ